MEIELWIDDLFDSPEKSFLVLKEFPGERKLMLNINQHLYNRLMSALSYSQSNVPPPPRNEPEYVYEAIISTWKYWGMETEKVVIGDLINGIYHSHVFFKKIGNTKPKPINMVVADAIIIALLTGCSVFTTEKVFIKTKREGEMLAIKSMMRYATPQV